MSLIEWIELRERADSRGALVAIEGGTTVPFDIRRVYYVYGAHPSMPRGFHAHRALRQVAICVAGSCRIVLDDGRLRQDVLLDRPERGLLIRQMVWHEMHEFTPESVLLVLASEAYDEQDYIRDYSVFSNAISPSS